MDIDFYVGVQLPITNSTDFIDIVEHSATLTGGLEEHSPSEVVELS